MAFFFRRSLGLIGVACLCVAFGAPVATAGEPDYVLRAGDTLDLFVAGAPELRGRFVVQLDGGVSLPMIGRIEAAGRSLSDLQRQAKAGFAARSYRSRTPDGREITSVLQPDEVALSVAEYQPIYVSGDVSKPGEQGFRPGKTARQAIAVSGGPDVVRFRAVHPGVEAADAKAEFDRLSIEIVKRRIAIWRLRRELGGPDQLDLSALGGGTVGPADVRAMAELETSLFDSRSADFAKQRGSLELAAREVEQQLKIMNDQLEKEEQGRQADVAELAKVQEMFSKGALPSPRVTDARRAVLLSATRKLQVESTIAQYRRQKNDIDSSLMRLDDVRRIEIQDRLTAENAALVEAEARIGSTVTKIRYLGLLRASLSSPSDDMFDVTVHRGGESLRVRQNFLLAPGDVVEVTLRTDLTTIGAPPVDARSSSAPPNDPPSASKS